jgi:murein DD-endopeptidase MepM/ murein hydrolase activator NlpD
MTKVALQSAPVRVLGVLLFSAAAFAQDFAVKPAAVRQGDTIRVLAPVSAETARMAARTIRLFAQPEGARLGLMPVPVDQKPGVYPLEFLAQNGDVIHKQMVTVRDARFPTQNIIITEEKRELKPAPGEQETVAAFRNTVSEARSWAEPFVAPLPGCMNSPFGVARLHNRKPTGDYHAGLDQRSPAGKPLHAVAGGVVKIARMFNLRGGTVGIDHGQGMESIYLHMSRVAAVEGARVNKGDVIGYVGATGRATGPHLHWALYVNGVPVNPRQWVVLQPCVARARGR